MIYNERACDRDLLNDGTVEIKKGDGWEGVRSRENSVFLMLLVTIFVRKYEMIDNDVWNQDPSNGPYDAIHVGAAAISVPESLVRQLKPEGRMLIPVGPQVVQFLGLIMM